MIDYRSDNTGRAAPEILEALVRANTGTALGYGADEWTARLQERLRTVLDRPEYFARIGTDLRERVLANFNHASTVEETEKVLVRVVRQRNRVLPVPEPLATNCQRGTRL